jgi:predicted Rossmann fold nucleotide-binding protein DprA/Smf involved in DNA uptake
MISNDSLAMLMLCSRLGLEQDPDPKPLGLKKWNLIARKIRSSPLKSPGGLLGLSAEDLSRELDIEQSEADNLACLLERVGTIVIELDKLESLGIGVITRADSDYPERYRSRLKESAPPILFYAGEKELLGQRGIAIVGSRDVDVTGEKCAEWIGNACGLSGMVLYSGGAKGVDSISMISSLAARGFSVGVMANNMDRSLRVPEYRNSIQKENMCIITPYLPSASFNVGLAMGRNRLIYTLADFSIVVASSANKGGTWSGAIENLKYNWVPLFVVEYDGMPIGNQFLIDKGGIPLPLSEIEDYSRLGDHLNTNASNSDQKPLQPTLW